MNKKKLEETVGLEVDKESKRDNYEVEKKRWEDDGFIHLKA